MEDEILDFDELLNEMETEASAEVQEPQAAEEPAAEVEKKSKDSSKHKNKKKKKKGSKKKKKSFLARFFTFIGKLLLILVETALLLVIVLYGVLYVVLEGPSPTARNLVTMSLRETSAMYWVPELFLSGDVIAEIEKGGSEVEEFVETDTSLIVIQKPEDKVEQTGGEEQQEQIPGADAWGLVDEDGDGIILEPVRGEATGQAFRCGSRYQRRWL